MRNILIPVMLLLTFSLLGQSIPDAIRLSSAQYFSTARVAGSGSSFGALGADFGSIGINPAGMGAFRTGEINFSFSTNKVTSDAYLNGSESSSVIAETNNKLKFDNFNLVFHNKPIGSDWKASNFGFGFSRKANFDQTTLWSGQTNGSATDRFLERANGKSLDELDNFEGGLAWDVYALNGPDQDLYYYSDYNKYTPNNLLDKEQQIYATGGINEMNFSYGANYKEALLIGISIGVPFINYNEEKYYTEMPLATDENSVFNQLEYREFLSTSGIGINFNAGVIGVLNKIIRVGAAVNSPSYFTLQDDYRTEMLYEFEEAGTVYTYEDGSPDGNFTYKFRTPWKYTGSLGIVLDFGDLNGFINFDAEYADYSTGEFNFSYASSAIEDKENEQAQNSNIRLELKPAMSYKLGGEVAFKKWRARMGYVLGESVFSDPEFKFDNKVLSAGIGFRGWAYYVDLAWVYSSNSYGYSPYKLKDDVDGLQPDVSIDKQLSKWIFTFGYKF